MLMLLFYSGEARYAISGDVVVEVVPNVALSELPTAPEQVCGLLSYSGLSIPVIDFRMLMEGLHSSDVLSTRIILVKGNVQSYELLLGLRAEKVTEVFEAELVSFQSQGIACEKWPFLDGVIGSENKVIQRVDEDKLFSWYSKVLQKPTEEAIEAAKCE